MHMCLQVAIAGFSLHLRDHRWIAVLEWQVPPTHLDGDDELGNDGKNFGATSLHEGQREQMVISRPAAASIAGTAVRFAPLPPSCVRACELERALHSP
eukprot:1158658-Pelagomonas_calceolata.AAC.2